MCLIPSSRRTAPTRASAVHGRACGWCVVKCGDDGAVDLGDLRAKLAEHAGAAGRDHGDLPVRPTACSRQTIDRRLRARARRAAGRCTWTAPTSTRWSGSPGRASSAPTSRHLNLHKTFCIPHGGGGPGVGPVAVRGAPGAVPARPPAAPEPGAATGIGPVAAAPYGSAGILPISWAYIAMMGAGRAAPGDRRWRSSPPTTSRHGCASTTRCSTRGQGGLVAHECILDLRPITKATGVTVDDVGQAADRLRLPRADDVVPGGRHADGRADRESRTWPSWTGSATAMIAIRQEIDAGRERRVADSQDNPLAQRPAHGVSCCSFARLEASPRSRRRCPGAGGPAAHIGAGAAGSTRPYGDRHLVCACPSPEAFAD